jgi:hypothetical protein
MLLDGPANNEKNDLLPLAWMEKAYPNKDQRKAAAERNDVPYSDSDAKELLLPSSPAEFASFFEGRKEKLRTRLTSMLS